MRLGRNLIKQAAITIWNSLGQSLGWKRSRSLVQKSNNNNRFYSKAGSPFLLITIAGLFAFFKAVGNQGADSAERSFGIVALYTDLQGCAIAGCQ